MFLYWWTGVLKLNFLDLKLFYDMAYFSPIFTIQL